MTSLRTRQHISAVAAFRELSGAEPATDVEFAQNWNLKQTGNTKRIDVETENQCAGLV